MVRHPVAYIQRAFATFLALGHHDALLRRLAHAYSERSQALMAALDAHLPEARYVPVTGGASCWVEAAVAGCDAPRRRCTGSPHPDRAGQRVLRTMKATRGAASGWGFPRSRSNGSSRVCGRSRNACVRNDRGLTARERRRAPARRSHLEARMFCALQLEDPFRRSAVFTLRGLAAAPCGSSFRVSVNRRCERKMYRFDRRVIFLGAIGHHVRQPHSHAAAARLQHTIAGIHLVSIRLVNQIKTLQLSKSD